MTQLEGMEPDDRVAMPRESTLANCWRAGMGRAIQASRVEADTVWAVFTTRKAPGEGSVTS
jgi:hypothetical protein